MENNNFDENWNYLGDTIYKKDYNHINPDISSDDSYYQKNSTTKPHKQFLILSPVISLQLIICLIVLTAAFLFNALLNNMFCSFKSAYDEELYASMLFDGELKNVDYSALFNPKSDSR